MSFWDRLMPGEASPGLRILKSIDRSVLVLNRALMIAVLAAMSVIVFTNVAMRYLTDDSIMWSEEVARYLMIWLTFLGIGPVLRLGGHIAVDSFLLVVSPRIAQIARAIIAFMLVAFFAVIGWVGYMLVLRTLQQTTPVTQIPFAVVTAAVPTGFALAIWHLLAVVGGYVQDARFEKSSDLSPEEVGSV